MILDPETSSGWQEYEYPRGSTCPAYDATVITEGTSFYSKELCGVPFNKIVYTIVYTTHLSFPWKRESRNKKQIATID